MQSSAKSVKAYLAELPPERREAITTLRQLILDNLEPGFKEGMLWGMIGYYVPLEVFPDTYNKQPLCYISLASQKNYMALYLMTIYGNPENEKWFREGFANAGKKLDMGKSCVRFKRIDDLPLDIIKKTVGLKSATQYVSSYNKIRDDMKHN